MDYNDNKIFGRPQGDIGSKLPSICIQPKQLFKKYSLLIKKLLKSIYIFYFWLTSKCHRMYVPNKL